MRLSKLKQWMRKQKVGDSPLKEWLGSYVKINSPQLTILIQDPHNFPDFNNHSKLTQVGNKLFAPGGGFSIMLFGHLSCCLLTVGEWGVNVQQSEVELHWFEIVSRMHASHSQLLSSKQWFSVESDGTRTLGNVWRHWGWALAVPGT